MTTKELHRLVNGVVGNYTRRRPEDRDDAAQEAWVAVQEALPRYQEDRGSLRAFLAVAIVRRLAWVLHGTAAPRDVDYAALVVGPWRGPDPEAQLAQLEWCARVTRVAVDALRGLPDTEAALEILRGAPIPEVCRSAGRNPRQLKAAVKNARERLARVVELVQLFKEVA